MKAPEKRVHPIRRQFNEAFCDPNGVFSFSKFIAAWGQIAALFHFGKSFDLLIAKPESLLIILTFVVAPEIFKKLITMKYGGEMSSSTTTETSVKRVTK